MGSAALTNEQIRAAVVKHWSDQFGATPHVLYPGGQLDTQSIAEWVELAVESFERPAQRRTGKDVRRVIVTVHCWAKFGTNQGRITELADAAVAVLDHAVLTLRDYGAMGDPVVGHLVLFESELAEMSRGEQDRAGIDVHHQVIRVGGVAYGV